MRKIRTALIGCGKVGQIHATALRDLPESELVATCDRDAGRAQAFAERFGYKLAILPGMLFKAVIGACDQMLEALKRDNTHPPPIKDMALREAFARLGADEWDRLREPLRR